MGVLDGIRVVEMATGGPGMFCGMFLADLGADVIAVERPAADAGRPRPELIPNRGKRSVMLDLEQPDAVDAVLKLVDTADVLIEGMRPGVMERLGLGPQVCLARRPSLVYGRLSGWGQEGPLAQAPGYDGNVAALSGALWLATEPGEHPQASPNLLAGVAGGALYLMLGVLAAAIRAQAGGRGQVVDAAMVDGSANLLNLMLAMLPGRDGNFDFVRPNGFRRPWIRSYRCADGEWIRVEPDEPQFYAEFLQRLGLDHDPRFVDGQKHRGDWPAVAAGFDAIFATRTRAQWCELLEGTDACVSPILTPAEATQHPHNVAREVYQAVDGVLQAAPAPRFSATPSATGARVPPRGAHTHEVLRELGLDAARVGVSRP